MRRLGAISLFAAACTTAQGPEPTPSPRVPLAATAPSVARPLASAGATGTPVGEERFAPWLTRPGFERVADAVEAGDARRAASELDRRLAASPPAQRDAPSLDLLAGVWHERAGEPTAALAAYERAKTADFVLAAYAAAGRARVLVALGRGAEALAEARALPDLPCVAAGRSELVAQAALAAGERDVALATLRAQAKSGGAARERWTAALRLASELLTPHAAGDAGVPPPVDAASISEALGLARRVEAEAAASPELEKRAAELEKQALAELPAADRAHDALPEPAELLLAIEALVDARDNDEALERADALERLLGEKRAGASKPSDDVACRLVLARGKAHAQKRDRKGAFEIVTAGLKRCEVNPELHARALFNAGKYAAQDGRGNDAVRYFGRVESEHHEHSLADDARLQAAMAYLDLGVEARFTDLLKSLPDDYPNGDMAVEGAFRLAVRRIDKGDWSGAASVLARAVRLVGDSDADAARGTELSGRERYFEARAALALGQRAAALDTFDGIVREQPLSYYMLHAYARLHELDPERAERARREAIEHARAEPRPRPPARWESEPGFARALELFRVGEISPAVAELDALGLTRPGAGPELLWAVARLYALAGAEKLAHDVARRRLTDWLLRWPVGDWQEAWRIAFPEPYATLVTSVTKRTGLEKPIVYAIMREESAFDPDAESAADAYGLMQLIVPTARVAAKGTTLPHDRRALKRPSVNIELGCRTLARYQTAFADNPLLAIPAYNAGPSKVKQWLRARPSADFDLWVELIPFLETRRYTKRVLASRAAYGFLADPEHGARALELPKKVRQ
ncbi:MAG TPA: lytic transglycosylase domain-containing protein [Polyangiaceae bacterium]|nr:lytic transglycosylase domain-containing protein [Polyangiaceae bacterium]